MNASSGPHDAYYCDIDRMPPTGYRLNRKTEASDEEYAAIAASDDLRWVTPDPGFSDEVFMWFDMIIEEAAVSVTGLNFTFEGYLNSGSDFQIWVYNAESSSPEQVGVDMYIPSGADAVMTRSIESDCQHYIDAGGRLIWGVYAETSSKRLNLDYASLVVSHTCPAPAPTPTPTCTQTP